MTWLGKWTKLPGNTETHWIYEIVCCIKQIKKQRMYVSFVVCKMNVDDELHFLFKMPITY